MYGEDEGLMAGSYAKPSPFTEHVQMSGVSKPRQPEKVRPVFYQEPEPEITAEMFLPRATMPVASERTVNARPTDQTELTDLPRMTASAARPGDQVRHIGSVDIAPRRVTEQP